MHMRTDEERCVWGGGGGVDPSVVSHLKWECEV